MQNLPKVFSSLVTNESKLKVFVQNIKLSMSKKSIKYSYMLFYWITQHGFIGQDFRFSSFENCWKFERESMYFKPL